MDGMSGSQGPTKSEDYSQYSNRTFSDVSKGAATESPANPNNWVDPVRWRSASEGGPAILQRFQRKRSPPPPFPCKYGAGKRSSCISKNNPVFRTTERAEKLKPAPSKYYTLFPGPSACLQWGTAADRSD